MAKIAPRRVAKNNCKPSLSYLKPSAKSSKVTQSVISANNGINSSAPLQLTKNNIDKGLYPKPFAKSFKVTIPVVSMNKGVDSSDWGDFVYRYFSDADALKLFFIRTTPGLVRDTEDFPPGIVVDYDANERIVVVEIQRASKLLVCDLVDAPYILTKDGKQPMQLCPYYDNCKDCFEVFFVNPDNAMPTEETVVKGTNEKIFLLYNSKHQIVGLKFPKASTTICKKNT